MNKDIQNLKEEIYKETELAIKGLSLIKDALERNDKSDNEIKSTQTNLLNMLWNTIHAPFFKYSLKLEDGVFQLNKSGVEDYLCNIGKQKELA